MKISLESFELEDRELTQRRFTRREFDEAETYLRHIIARRGLRPTYAALLALTFRKTGRYNDALSILDESLAQHPRSMQLYAKKGDIHFARMEYGLAAENFAKALSSDEKDCVNPMAESFVRNNLARAKCFLDDAAEAVLLLRPLVVTYPVERRFRENYALALAKSAENISISDLPDIEEPYAEYLGVFVCRNLLAERRFHDALKCSKQVLEKYPNVPNAICCHADVLFRIMRFEQAADVLENAVRRHVDVNLHLALAKCYKAMGQVQLTREAYLAGLFHFPDNLSFLYSLFVLDDSLGNVSECRKSYERIMEIPGAYSHLWMGNIASIARFSSNDSVLPENNEGNWIKKCLGYVKKSDQVKPVEAHDPDKVVLPQTIAHDLPERASLRVVFRNNALAYEDVQSVRCNIRNGQRIVVNQPSEYAYTVFLAGRCMATDGCYDSTTLASALQDVFNSRSAEKVRIVSYGGVNVVGCIENLWLHLIHSKELRFGDKVLHFDCLPVYTAKSHCYDDIFDKWVAERNMFRNSLTRHGAGLYIGFMLGLEDDRYRTLADDKLYEAHCKFEQIPADWRALKRHLVNRLTDNEFAFSFFDDVLQYKSPDNEGRFWRDRLHHMFSINWPLAEAIYEFLSRPSPMKLMENLPSFKERSMSFLQDNAFIQWRENEGIRSWITETYDADISNRKNVGAIVMNCNPFTLGHRYLVEKALESVEALYLFVVEEDLSQFSFADRLMLVREGVREFGDRVKVVPSGKFIISSFSFAGYFTKAVEITPPDSTTDVLIFASMIAPALNIRTRFVGEEPTCMVTRSYNERMLLLLPDMGCAVKVIPRKEISGTAISASRVRAALKANDMQSIKALVPNTTYDYLVKRQQHKIDYRETV